MAKKSTATRPTGKRAPIKSTSKKTAPPSPKTSRKPSPKTSRKTSSKTSRKTPKKTAERSFLFTGFPGFIGARLIPRLLQLDPSMVLECLVQEKFHGNALDSVESMDAV